MTAVSIEDAEQVLRPPADGLPFLRHDRAADLRLDRCSLALRDGRIAAL